MIIHHLAAQADWDRRDTYYMPGSLPADGFVHCSDRRQLVRVANELFEGRTDLLLLDIDTDQLEAPLIWEDLRSEGEDYPHVYGRIPLDSITKVRTFVPALDGKFEEPAT